MKPGEIPILKNKQRIIIEVRGMGIKNIEKSGRNIVRKTKE